MARKDNSDSVKPGFGIDGAKGEKFTRQHAGNPWAPPRLSDELSPAADRKAKHASDDDAGLRQKRFTVSNFDDTTYSIDADVEANLGPSGAITKRGE